MVFPVKMLRAYAREFSFCIFIIFFSLTSTVILYCNISSCLSSIITPIYKQKLIRTRKRFVSVTSWPKLSRSLPRHLRPNRASGRSLLLSDRHPLPSAHYLLATFPSMWPLIQPLSKATWHSISKVKGHAQNPGCKQAEMITIFPQQ